MLRLSVLVLVLVLVGCRSTPGPAEPGDGSTQVAPDGGSAADSELAKLEVTPGDASLELKQTRAFTAKVTTPSGSEVQNAKLSWSVVPPRVAKVDVSGVVTALAPGNATLTVRAGALR